MLMQRKLMESSSTIFQTFNSQFPKLTIYSDGIGLERIGNMRVSNLKRNISSHALFTMALLFAQHVVLSEATTYFASPDNKNNYKLDFDTRAVNVVVGDCNTVSVDHAVLYGYDEVKNWVNNDDAKSRRDEPTKYFARFFKGSGEPSNNDISNCIIKLIQDQIDSYESNPTHSSAKMFGIIIGGIFGSKP